MRYLLCLYGVKQCVWDRDVRVSTCRYAYSVHRRQRQPSMHVWAGPLPTMAACYSIRRILFPVSSITTRTKISLKIQAPQKKRKRLYRACTHRAARTTQCSPATPLPFSILSPKQRQHTPPFSAVTSHFTCPYLHQHSRYNTQCLVLTQYTCSCGRRIRGHSKAPGSLHVDTCIWNKWVHRPCVRKYLSLPWMPCPVPCAPFLRGLRVGLPRVAVIGSG